MPCLLGLIAFFTPRLVIIVLLITSSWITACFRSLPWPFAGLLIPIAALAFLPYTLLAYCLAWHQTSGHVGGLWIILVIFAALLDLGVIGGGAARKKRKQ